MQSKIIIRGHEFMATETGDDFCPYTLTGENGTVYLAIRNLHDAHLLFLIAPHGRSLGIWLSDAEGALRVVQVHEDRTSGKKSTNP